MTKFEGTINKIGKDIKKNKGSWSLPNIYVDNQGNICYDVGSTVDVSRISVTMLRCTEMS